MTLKKYLTILREILAEGTDQTFTGSLKDVEGVPIDAADLTEMKMTLYDAGTGNIINSRDHVPILGENGGSVQAGEWKLEIGPNDMAIVTETNQTEVHVLLVEWTATNGKRGKALIIMTVENLLKVPPPAP